MKLIFVLVTCLIPIIGWSQGVWESPVTEKNNINNDTSVSKDTTPDPDEKYLVGAVPEVNGKVEWKLDVDVPDKSAQEIYDIIFDCFTNLTKEENQLEGSCVSLVNKKEHIVVASMKEWLVFTDKLLALDRTKFNYTLIAYCKDNHLTVTMGRVSYRYDEERIKGGHVYMAEEWINDENALNRKKTRLLPGSAKFRRKTIDRKDLVFDTIKTAVLK
ncbi:DUF4468 domain-containing protein [uncultured Prevotella sp.]|uniref:DUF4468 domain-containing protein n=1 Tax=uncultured Prevotella sp. TaxID=159272 RepID=UPI0026379080|nr:DUF4468 domain-containing protein [uncultured Prevotella sp.]